MLRAMWLVVAPDLLDYRDMDDAIKKLVFFVLLNTVRRFENVCENISEPWKEFSRSYLQRRKNGETEKKSFWLLENG